MSHNDFIECYPNVLSSEQCADLIRRFARSPEIKPGRVGGGVMPELKDSSDLAIDPTPEWVDAVNLLNQAVFSCLLRYFRTYPYALIAPLSLEHHPADGGPPRRLQAQDIVESTDARLTELLVALFRPGGINLQRYTANRGGYPYWHCELYPMGRDAEPLHRHLLWTIYLNDDFTEGETEFLHQQRKIAPATGSVLIAPSAFTHTHRGNMPKSGDKVIATSWVLFQRAETLYGNG